MYNGHGIFNHANGYTYEGVFENHKPYRLTSKLAISVTRNEIEEGLTCFDVEVKSLSENNKLFKGI